MASRDRYDLETIVETCSAPKKEPQGELFARIALRSLPLMKEGPEDLWIDTSRTIH